MFASWVLTKDVDCLMLDVKSLESFGAQLISVRLNLNTLFPKVCTDVRSETINILDVK